MGEWEYVERDETVARRHRDGPFITVDWRRLLAPVCWVRGHRWGPGEWWFHYECERCLVVMANWVETTDEAGNRWVQRIEPDGTHIEGRRTFRYGPTSAYPPRGVTPTEG